ncbi:MAG TPA: FAD-dependent oxidoreductase [Candidatus Dormibacteraeota bacterium]|nr:FAD-dependent oxidoreductase [Candidatus Dormibacteraeota bacterium]
MTDESILSGATRPVEAGPDPDREVGGGGGQVVVVGGGISGLASAYALARAGARVLLLERGPRLGGKILTRPLAGLPLEGGPDGFLDRPEVVALCRELGLEAELVGTLTTQAYRWEGTGLRPLEAETGRPAAARPLPARLLSLRDGLQRLVERLEQELRARQVQVRLLAPVEGVEAPSGAGLSVRLATGEAISADAVVVGVPAPQAARLVSALSPGAAGELMEIRYLDLAVINLIYPGRPWALPGSGFLVAERDGRLISGCTWLSAKWPHLDRPGCTAMRVTVGGSGRREWAELDDRTLVRTVHQELTLALGPAPAPGPTDVIRWQQAVPDPRSLDPGRAARVQAALPPGLALASGGYRGGGIASCIAAAAEAVELALRRLRAG